MSSSGAGSIDQVLCRAKPLIVLVLAGVVVASISACVAAQSRSPSSGPASTIVAASDSPSDGPSSVETASPAPRVSPVPPGRTVAWTQLSSGSLPAVEAPTNDVDMPDGILEGWHDGYVEFVWHPETYLLTPWTSTDARSWTAGTSINAGLIWKSELRAFVSGASEPVDPLGCSFASTGWADDGQALLFRGRLNCQLGCASYWESSETMLISTNGVAWTDVDERKVFGAGGLGSVSGGGSGFVGLGFVAHRQILWTSQDGLTWQQKALPVELTQPRASVADPASIEGALVVPGARLDSGTPYGSDSGYGPGAGVHDCVATTSNAPLPVYSPALYASSDGGSDWMAVNLPGAAKAMEVSMSVVRVDDNTLVAIEWGETDSGTTIWLYWVSSDGSTWKPVSMDPIATSPFPTPLSSAEGGLLYSTEYCPPAGNCSTVLTLYALSKDGQVVTLDQVGDAPAMGIHSEVVLGPAGILVSDGGSNMWLGTPG